MEDYLADVISVEQEATELLAGMVRLREDLASWPRIVADSTVNVIYDIVRDSGPIIMGHVFGETRRGAPVFQGVAPVPVDAHQYFTVRDDEDGDHYIDRGMQRIPVFWSVAARTALDRDRLRAVANRLAIAVSFGLQSELDQLRAVLDDMMREEGTTMHALEIARREIDRYSRFTVTATLSNHGRSTVAVDPRAMLFVRGGTTEADGAATAVSNPRHDVRIPLTRVQTSERSTLTITDAAQLTVSSTEKATEPIVVSAGEAVSATFASDDRIAFLENGAMALEMFSGVGSESYMVVLPLTADRLALATAQPKTSESYPFRRIDVSDSFSRLDARR